MDFNYFFGAVSAMGSVIALLAWLGLAPKISLHLKRPLKARLRLRLVLGLTALNCAVLGGTIYRDQNPRIHFAKGVSIREVKFKNFLNENVPLDGMSYTDCTFSNVTFVYNGTAPMGNFMHNTIRGGIWIKTENDAVSFAVDLFSGLGLMKPGLPIVGNETRAQSVEPQLTP